MKKIFSIIATCATLLLASCSKEKSIDSTDPNGPGTPDTENQGLLVKGVYTYGTDSMTTLYGYDSQKRLIKQSVTATDAGFIDLEFEIVRGNNGQISQYQYKSDEFLSFGLETVDYNVFFDATQGKYIYKTMEFEYQGHRIKDSTVYEYDAQNRIVNEQGFIRNPLTGVYNKTFISDYTYSSSGNLINVFNYYFDEDLNDFTLYYDASYEYDNKVSPLTLGNEAIILSTHNLYGSHNIVKQVTNYPDEPSNNNNLSVDITYNADNKPVSSTITEIRTGQTSSFKYYYQ